MGVLTMNVRSGVGAVVLAVVATVTTMVAIPAPAHAAAVDTFAYTLGTTISNGAPGAGAGNIEAVGNEDRYTFNGTAGQQIYLKVLSSNLTGGGGSFPGWKL